MRKHPYLLVLSLLFILGRSQPLSAQAGRVAGTVISGRSLQAIAGVQITVEGTDRKVTSDGRGRFQVDGLSGGEVTLRTVAIGFQPLTQTVRVGNAEVRLLLSELAVNLQEVIVTGQAGAVASRSVANAVSKIQATEVLEVAPVTDVAQLIRGRAAGALVRVANGTVGGGSRITLRGTTTLGLNDQPIIYVDGVRVDNKTGSSLVSEGNGTPNAAVSRLNDFNPEDIETIEILKGPAASTLYGTEAANGVIQIITKKGRRGDRVTWGAGVRQGTTWFQNPDSRFHLIYGKDASGAVFSINPYQLSLDQGEHPFTNGHLQAYELNASGGGDIVQYYVGGQLTRERGTDITQRLADYSGRVNVGITPSDKLIINSSVSYLRRHQQVPNDGGFGGPIYAFWNIRPALLTATNHGWLFGSPEQWQRGWQFFDDVDRFTGSVQITHRPTKWLSQRLAVGADLLADNNSTITPKMPADLALAFGAGLARGGRGYESRDATNTTIDYGASAEAKLTSRLHSTTSLGLQYFHKGEHLVTAGGGTFPAAGITTITATATRTAGEDFFENNTVGLYVQQQLALNDRLFVTGAVRADDNSAFGANFNAAYYPKVSATWVLSEEPFWKLGLINTLKVRTAYGESGQQPDVVAALRTYAPVVAGGGTSAVAPATIGNPDLKPERGKEIEIGFDAGLLRDRVGIEFTYYNKKTIDGIVAQQLAPSGGFPGSQFINIGELSSKGIELLINARLIETKKLNLDLTVNFATNDSKVISTGSSSGFLTIANAAAQRHADGFPVGAFFGQRVISAALNPTTKLAENILCDGGTGPRSLSPGGPGVPCASAPSVYLGRAFPTSFGSLSPTVTLFGRLQLYALVDFQRGFQRIDVNRTQQCPAGTCEEIFYPERFDVLRVAEQQLRLNTAFALSDGTFAKLREVSVRYTLPERWARLVGGSRAAVSLAGRHLHTWTGYTGLDPEPIRLSQTSNVGQFGLTPPNASFVGKIDVTF